MAFVDKTGGKHTNADSMKTANAKHMAHQPPMQAEPPEDEGAEQGAHDPQELEQLKQSFDSVMQALASGQKPDPQTVQQLVEVFNSFIDEEQHEVSEGY